jgi:hypothetical protein
MKETDPAHSGNGRSGAGSSPAFLLLAAGGAGKDSARSAVRHHEAAGRPFALYTLAIDTDPSGFDAFDSAINIAPTREAVSAILSNPHRHGPACQALFRHHPHLLERESLGRGARTHRPLTQAAFEIHEETLTEGFRAAIHALLRQEHGDRIQPVFVGSLGGGTGSAVAVLGLDFFVDGPRRDRMLLGLPPDLLAKPIAFAIDPYAHALQQTNEVAPDRILANIYATRMELAEYEKRGKGFQYVFHLGLGNDAGAVFSTIEQVCHANGLLVWSWMANYGYFKSRAVDGLDFEKVSCRYCGDDVPEAFFPAHERPPYAENAR